MKKILAAILAVALLVSMAACAKSENGDTSSSSTSSVDPNTLKDGESLQSIVDKVQEEFGDYYVQMAMDIDETALTDVFKIQPEWVEEYAGHYTMVMVSTDNFVAIKATEGHAEDVAAALEQRRADLEQQFAQYLPGPYEKAKAGRVITKGDYVFLIILGDDAAGVEEELDRAENIINDAFNG